MLVGGRNGKWTVVDVSHFGSRVETRVYGTLHLYITRTGQGIHTPPANTQPSLSPDHLLEWHLLIGSFQSTSLVARCRRLKCLQFTGIAAISLPRNAPHSNSLCCSLSSPLSAASCRKPGPTAISHVSQKSEQIGPGLDRPNAHPNRRERTPLPLKNTFSLSYFSCPSQA